MDPVHHHDNFLKPEDAGNPNLGKGWTPIGPSGCACEFPGTPLVDLARPRAFGLEV
jgi:hypothetical protein